MELVVRMEQTIREQQLISVGDRVVVAVSGGPDSVALLHLLHELAPSYSLELIVAHVNHGFRIAESGEEAQFVERLAERLALPCEVGTFDVPGYKEQVAMNAQAAAREIRYGFLREVAERSGAVRIALAHHADDQAETVLMRVVRGTGPAGLAGIPFKRLEKNVELIRPLLRIYKSELLEYCEARGLTYCHDSSNDERKYFRNQIRLDIMPFLNRYNGRLAHSLNRLADTVREESDYLDRETERIFSQEVHASPDVCRFARNCFVSLHVALQRRLIKLILNYLALEALSSDYTAVELVRSAIVQQEPTTMKLDVADHIRFTREYDVICLYKEAPTIAEPYEYVVHSGMEQIWIREADCRFMIRAEDTEGRSGPAYAERNWEAIFELDQIAWPLVIRNRRSGDRIRIVGLNGTKKVKDIFIDDKIPPSAREKQPIIVDGNGQLLWIPGIRKSSAAAADRLSGRKLRIAMRSASDM